MANIITETGLLPSGIEQTIRYDMNNGADIARYVARVQFAWPGGYEMVCMTADGGTLCHDCCWTEYRNIAESVRGNINDGWQVVGYFTTADDDGHIVCDHCGRVVQD